MKMNRGWLVTLMLILMMLLTSACTAQATTANVEEVAGGVINAAIQYMPRISLPRLVVTYDADGIPSIFGIKTTLIEKLVPVNLAFLQLPPATIEWFSRTNLQHIELDLNEDGLFVYANGKPLPYLAWDETSLDQTGDLIDSLNVVQFDTIIDRALPLLQRLGIDLVIQFPVAEGVEAIAMRPPEARALAMAGAVEPSAVIQVGVEYTSDGLPTVMGLTSRDLRSLTGIDISFLELREPTISAMKAVKLQSAELVTRPDGLYLTINGKELPHLAYSEEHLLNAIDVIAQLYGEMPFLSVVRNLVPVFHAANVDLAVQFPGSAVAD